MASTGSLHRQLVRAHRKLCGLLPTACLLLLPLPTARLRLATLYVRMNAVGSHLQEYCFLATGEEDAVELSIPWTHQQLFCLETQHLLFKATQMSPSPEPGSSSTTFPHAHTAPQTGVRERMAWDAPFVRAKLPARGAVESLRTG